MNESPPFEQALAELETDPPRPGGRHHDARREPRPVRARGRPPQAVLRPAPGGRTAQISLLAGLDGDGKPVLQPFDHAASDSDDAEPPAARIEASRPLSKSGF